MTERPIRFNGEMVRAILNGRKTQTRRVVETGSRDIVVDMVRLLGQNNEPTGEYGVCYHDRVITEHIYCPFGKPGDRLWVQEAYAVHQAADEQRIYPPGEGHLWGSPIFRATFGSALKPVCEGFTKWRPAIHMPRWASRITLEVVSRRVERLQEISCADALAEGIWASANSLTIDCEDRDPRKAFRALWDSIYGKKHPWESNPWVWVVEFRRLEDDATA